MDSPQDLRLSDSPQRTPQISRHLSSPPRSLRPELFLESVSSQTDMMPKDLNYFDDVSSDGLETIDANRPSTDIGTFLQCHNLDINREIQKPSNTEDQHKYEHVCDDSHGTSLARLSAPFQEPQRSPRTSACASANEMTAKDSPLDDVHTLEKSQPDIGRTPHRSADIVNLREKSQSDAVQMKTDKILSAHAIAHRITLQALINEGDELNNAWSGADRSSTLRPGSRLSDVQSHFDHFPSPIPQRLHKAQQSPYYVSQRAMTFPPASLKTPQVYEEEKDQHEGHATMASVGAYESALRVSIQRYHRHSSQRMAFIKIPASKDFTAVKDSPYKTKELHFRALEFDDATFFRELRRTYKILVGPWRFFSARSLTKIIPAGRAALVTNPIDDSQRTRSLTSHHRGEIISEEHFKRHFCRPDLGKSRWDFVDWAQRIAAESPSERRMMLNQRSSDSQNHHGTITTEPGQVPGCDGLEFILSWSIWRILLFFGVILLASMAATLCWTFLGKNTAATDGDGGFRDAGDRVGAAILMGVGVMLMGLCTMAGWLGASWVAM